jgi:hypothetical protein
MKTVAGLFHSQERAQAALDALLRAGFSTDDVALVASPTSARSFSRRYEVRVAQGGVLVTIEASTDSLASAAQQILRRLGEEHVTSVARAWSRSGAG